MTFSLRIWQKPGTEEIRLYVGGTNRESVYFKLSSDGHVVWSSKANDTPPKFRKGDHYGKCRKDGEAAAECADAYSLPLGDDSTIDDWNRILQIARDGISAESKEDADED